MKVGWVVGVQLHPPFQIKDMWQIVRHKVVHTSDHTFVKTYLVITIHLPVCYSANIYLNKG